MMDRHHILHFKPEWTLRPQAKLLRDTPTLIPRIDREVHNEIHRNAPGVPPLGHYALQRIVSDFYPQRTTLATLDDLMLAIENSTRTPKAHPIEIQMAELAVQALDIQRPFLREALGS